ncbi:MAG TPA: iron-sulfur cluster assembly scaffold protein [Pyrinomonadaceae bacterium]|nr:iron-sulfur cluster assembly scaffold protein [Pyrinomonadaceae bacterium]
MAKFYSEKISDRFHAPKNVGGATGANAVGTNATFVCGAALRLSLRIEKNTKEITEAKFKTNGCGYLIASADVLAERIVGKKLNELHGLDKSVLQKQIEDEFGKFSENRKHCLNLCIETLRDAFADFRVFQIEEFTGEKALVCTCFGVSEETIEGLIKQNSLETVEEVTDACNAGGGCGSCQPLIQELLDVYRSES